MHTTHFHHQHDYAGRPHESVTMMLARFLLAGAIAAATWLAIMLYIVN